MFTHTVRLTHLSLSLSLSLSFSLSLSLSVSLYKIEEIDDDEPKIQEITDDDVNTSYTAPPAE